MKPPFTLVTPERLQIREGGGCMSVFGIPFFAAGVFLFLSLLGIVPVSNADDLPTLAWPLLVLMAIAFTAVGGRSSRIRSQSARYTASTCNQPTGWRWQRYRACFPDHSGRRSSSRRSRCCAGTGN